MIGVFGCQKEDDSFIKQENTSQTLKTKYSITKIDYQTVQQNNRLVNSITKIKEQKDTKGSSTQNRLVHSSTYNFYIDTNVATYMENADGSYHSYTFPVIRDNPTVALENILFSLQADGTYKVSLVSYNLTENEKEALLNGQFVDLTNKASKEAIDSQALIDETVASMDMGCSDIILTYCTCDNHPAGYFSDGSPCDCYAIQIYTMCSGGGGGGGTDYPDNSDVPEGGGGSSGSGSPNNPPNEATSPTIFISYEEQIINCLGTYILNGNSSIQTWLSNANQRDKKALATYLGKGDNCSNPATLDFVVEAIEAMADGDVDSFAIALFISEQNCQSVGLEQEWTNNFEENEEPKWGQLANKQEILNEINNIIGLDNMPYEQQIISLASHFEKNLMYNRDNDGNLFIVDSANDVNRYIYSEIGGWIDFHHVFKIFEWATQNGPFTAITQGELGEMWQSLKDNYSAYSYEDLPSNLLGVGMYVRFSQDLAQGDISWYEAVQITLDELNCLEPEQAPNFLYIPHIVNEHYPQNFTYSPLLGNDLENYHREKFCQRPYSEQVNIKEAHEKFQR